MLLELWLRIGKRDAENGTELITTPDRGGQVIKKEEDERERRGPRHLNSLIIL